MPPIHRILVFAVLALSTVPGFSAEPVLPAGGVVALVGGEAMLAAAEAGYLEAEILRELPGRQLRFRCLAWEGDTVFEQRRDLNFPTIESQIDQVAASVVVAQFGEMESLAGESKLGEFVAAYEGLIDRLAAGGKRRVVLVGPLCAPALSEGQARRHEGKWRIYSAAIRELAERRGLLFVFPENPRAVDARQGADRLELREQQLAAMARSLAQQLSGKVRIERNAEIDVRWQALRPAIEAKNRLWFNYWRPQNWAFLNGDRTAQPSSRDHVDPSKRWFPAEMEQFLPLIEKQEREIDALAVKLSTP